MAQEVNLNIEELDSFVGHIIENNRFLQEQETCSNRSSG
jgi:hypothetical protein